MLCLHGKEAIGTTTQNGNFWICGQYPKCQFICTEEEGPLYEKGIQAFLAVNQILPKCCVLEYSDDPQECNYAKICVVKDPQKKSYGRPFFKCSKKNDRCNYFEWGDETIIEKPLCVHGKRCNMWKVKKEGPNHGRTFFTCPERKGKQCKSFSWVEPPTPPTSPDAIPGTQEHQSAYTPNYYMNYSKTAPIPIPKRKKKM